MSGSMTGGVDSSIGLNSANSLLALKAGQGVTQPINPLQAAGQFADLRAKMNQNALFPGQQALQQQAVQGGKLDLATHFRQAGAAAMTPLLAKQGPLSLDDVTTSMAGAEASGISSQPTLDAISKIPANDPVALDAGIRAYIKANAQPAQSAAAAVVPNVGIQDTGPGLQGVSQQQGGMPGAGALVPMGAAVPKGIAPQFVGANNTPTSGGAPTGPPIPNALTPAQIATPTQIGVDPKTGAPIMGTLGQFLAQSGGAGPSPLGTGRPIPPALRGPNAPPAAQPGIPMGIGPAREQQMSVQGAQSAKAFQDIADQGVKARQQNALLGNMLGDVQGFSQGQANLNAYKATLMKYAPSLGPTFGVSPDQVAQNESFNKLAAQISDAQGAGSDARLAVNQHANPNETLSPAGTDLIIRQLQGNAAYTQARAKLAASYPDQTDRAGFESKVASNLDPRAFQLQAMTPAQRQTYISNLPKDDQAAVRKAYNYAHSNGLVGEQTAAAPNGY